MSEPLVPAWTVQGSRRVEVRATITRADGRVEDIGLIAGTEADGTPMAPDPRPVGVEHGEAVAWVFGQIASVTQPFDLDAAGALARAIIDELFRYGPIVPNGTPGARTNLGGG